MATWYDQADTLEESLQLQVSVDRDGLCQLLLAGRYHRDGDGALMEDLGFLIGIWNGDHEDRALGLSISCGIYSALGGINNVQLHGLRTDWPENWLTADIAVELVRAAVSAWRPDWAGVCSRPAWEQALGSDDYDVEQPFVDWVIYRRGERRHALPSHARVGFTMHGGECIVVQETPIHIDNRAHRARVRAVATALEL